MDDHSPPPPDANNADNSIGEVQPQHADFATPFTTASGGTLPRWRLAYETHGTFNAAKIAKRAHAGQLKKLLNPATPTKSGIDG